MLTYLFLAAIITAEPDKPFAIAVVDAQTGRGVPLIELKTVHGLRLFTDSNGIVAFREPGLMNETVFFHISGHGYEFPKDGFGFRGKQIKITPGGSEKLKIQRVNIAERLYRVTGAGIYRDSTLVGTKVPIKEPLLNAQVFGSDSVVNALYQGKLHWFWGDTNRPSYPLGNFHVPGAVSELPGKGGLDPDIGVDLTYFADEKGFAKKTLDMPGKGPTWMVSLAPVPDKAGREQLVCSFVKVEAPLKIYSRGFAIWNQETKQFDKKNDVDMSAPIFPMGHGLRFNDCGVEFIYFAHPYPLTRVPATVEAYLDPSRYETFTCLKKGTRLDSPQLDRDADGRLHYAWKTNTPAVGPAEQAKLIAAGKMKANESMIDLRDRDTGKAVTAHAGSVAWNEYRQRFTLVAVEHFGKPSMLGEVWYAEADLPTGPWNYAVKIVTHDRMSFYNPKQHPYFAKDNGRTIYFEGTYTHDFSGNPDTTPRYEYNQVMYRLDLNDVRAALPRPVPTTDFLAIDRAAPGSIRLPGETTYFMLPDNKSAPAATVPLFEFKRGTETKLAIADRIDGYTKSEKPLGRVWPASAP